MKERKSYLKNYSTDSLFLVLEQNQTELLELEFKKLTHSNLLLQKRIQQIKFQVAIIQNIIVERFLEDSISLVECTRLFIKARGIRKEVYQELFTIKILEADEMLSLDLLEQAMNQLEPEPLMRILRAKENSIYGYLASKTYMKMLFDVEEEVLEELKQKIKIDNE